jgi:acetyl-CoA carboxylase biotin carboxyl carrier protein
MKAKEIRDLIDFIAQSPLDEVNIETDEFKINVKRYGGVPVVKSQEFGTTQPLITPQVQPQQVITSQPVAISSEVKPSETTENKNLVIIKSPMIGTFYRSSKPDSPLFVNVGDEVKTGQTVCIIEAMKLFNEIESEISGKIVKVLVENATPVEYDQPLFLVEPA